MCTSIHVSCIVIQNEIEQNLTECFPPSVELLFIFLLFTSSYFPLNLPPPLAPAFAFFLAGVFLSSL